MSKTVALSDEAYAALARLKRPGESFSQLALRLATGKDQRRILDYAGTLKMSDKEADDLLKNIRKWRDESGRGRPRW